MAVVICSDRILTDLSLFPHLGLVSEHERLIGLGLLEKKLWPPSVSVLRNQGQGVREEPLAPLLSSKFHLALPSEAVGSSSGHTGGAADRQTDI